MDRKVAKYSSSQGIGGKKPCIVRITRSSRPRWLSKMISLPLDAQMNSYANKLSKMFSSPKSALIITSSIALPKEIFGRNTELEPIKCTITHINFLTNNLKIILHSSTKAKLLAAYSHFLTTWPLRHALQSMKELLRKKFIQDMEKLKWKVGCEVLKCADRQGRGNLQDLHSRIASSFQGESDKGRRKKEPGKTSPPITKFPIGLEDLLEGAVEAIKSLFVPGLPASVPVNIWGIPWRVSKDNIKRFIQGNNTEKGSNYYPFEDAIETRSRRSFPTKRERVPRTDEESDEESEWESDGEEDDEEEDDEILETIVLAPYIPVAAPPVLSKFQITVRYFESNFLRLYNLQRKRYDDSHPVAVPLTARVKYKQSREILKLPTQYGTKRSREDSESSSDSGSFVKRTKFNKTGRISSYGTAPLGQVSRPNILANTQNSQTQHGVRGKRSRSESSSSPEVFVPAKRLKSHRPANISETSNGSKFRRPSISSASTGYRTESEHYEIADCKHGMLEDSESSDHERQQQTRNQSHMEAVYATNSDDEIRFPTPPLSTEMESMESDDETETDEWSEESEAEPVWPSRCQGGKFKSGYEESAAAREWYYV